MVSVYFSCSQQELQHQSVFENLFFSHETQKNGLVLLYDMSGSGYHNFDYSLARKIMNLLKVLVNKAFC